MNATRKPQPAWRLNVNKRSARMTDEDNDNLFALLGPNCQSMCTAVAKVHTTEAPARLAWLFRHSGVLCFVRDIARHSFYMRLYCLRSAQLMWEEERCVTMSFRKSANWLLILQGRNKLMAFDFADELEASWFYKIAVLANQSSRKIHQARRLSACDFLMPATATQPAPTSHANVDTVDDVQRNPPWSSTFPSSPAATRIPAPQFGGLVCRDRCARPLRSSCIDPETMQSTLTANPVQPVVRKYRSDLMIRSPANKPSVLPIPKSKVRMKSKTLYPPPPVSFSDRLLQEIQQGILNLRPL